MFSARIFSVVLVSSTVLSANAYVPQTPTVLMRTFTKRFVHHTRDADVYEQLVGGERYSMIPMPNNMRETTIFVGNLCEFINDDDLSGLFGEVTLHSVPACVARKPNTNSLNYGFVSFSNISEKEAAIERFNNYEWRGRRLKVESIVDHPRGGPVRIPEKLVHYVCGSKRMEYVPPVKKNARKKPNKKVNKGDGGLPENLRQQLERAMKKGFLVLEKKQPRLKAVHREWCETVRKPQIVFYKNTGNSVLDQVTVDLSTLRMPASYLITHQTQILSEALESNMELLDEWMDEEDELDLVAPLQDRLVIDGRRLTRLAKLPVLSLGIFQGERSNAKAMAANLGKLWDISVDIPKKKRPGRQRMRRQRGGGNRQAW